MLKNLGNKVIEGAYEKIKEADAHEWVTFECFANHEFALKVRKDMNVNEYILVLSKVHCPICQTKSVNKKGGM